MADAGARRYTTPVRRLPLLLVCLPLAGCGRLDTLSDVLNDLVTPTVADGLYVGVELPDGLDFGFSDDYAVAACQMFLAAVDDPTQIDSAPMDDAKVAFDSPQNDEIAIPDQGDGKYRITSYDGLRYVPGDTATVTFTDSFGGSGTMAASTPAAPEADLPVTGTALQAFTVTTAEPWDNLLVAVYDLDRSEVAYNNLPEAVEDIYAYTHPEEQTDRIEVPGDAIKRAGNYVIGVAGMELADPESFDGVNISLSSFMTGRFTVGLLVVSAKGA